MSNWFIDGEPRTALPVDDRAVQYGDGLFETIAVRHGSLRFWDLHFERLATGCARLGLAAPQQRELREQVQQALSHSLTGLDYATAKLILTAGRSERGYRRAASPAVTTVIGLFPARPRPAAAYRDGVEVTICQTRLAQQPQLAGIKTLNRLEQVLAQGEWQDENIVEGLMLDTDGRLICGTMSNVFLLRDNKVVAPAITRCGVAGIMRRKIIETLEAHAIAYEVRDIDSNELAGADGVFLSNSQFGLLPVSRCGNNAWRIPDLTRNIMRHMANAGVAECKS